MAVDAAEAKVVDAVEKRMFIDEKWADATAGGRSRSWTLRPGGCCARWRMRFGTEAKVIAAANDTEYGLVGYVYTNDLRRALRVAESIETGMGVPPTLTYVD